MRGFNRCGLGNPQWSMHSIRETCGTADVELAIKLLNTFYSTFSAIDGGMPKL